MADKLILADLTVPCHIGVTESERQTAQSLWIDVELDIDAAHAAESDDIVDAIDYARLISLIEAEISNRPFRLLETVAQEVAELILDTFHLTTVLVRVKKRAVAHLGFAAVEIVRTTAGHRA